MASKFMQLALVLALVTLLTASPCVTSQYATIDGTCVQCPTTCTSCSNADFCTQCRTNYFLVSGTFNVTCQACAQIFVGCKTCLSNVACTQCNEGYFLSNGVCKPCAVSTLYCTKCSIDGSVCTACNYPFIIQGAMCVSGTVSAIVTTTTTTTTPGTSTPTTPTVIDTRITLSDGTKVNPIFDFNGCNQIQIFINGKCISKISNCATYQQSGLCQSCANNYQVTIFGDCSPINFNLRCESGFWLNTNLDKCIPVSVTCDWYYPNNGSCFNCSKGYVMKDSVCIQDQSCNSRQFFYQGSCITVPASCATFTSDGICTSCITGYNFKGGICSLSIQNIAVSLCTFPCRTCHYSELAFCYSCQLSYELAGAQYGKCIPVVN